MKIEEFGQLGGEDKIMIMQVGQHAFAVGYSSDSKTCITSDGLNTFSDCRLTRALVLARLRGARRVRHVAFQGQKEIDNCGSSTAAIAIELQRHHGHWDFDDEIKVASSTHSRRTKNRGALNIHKC